MLPSWLLTPLEALNTSGEQKNKKCSVSQLESLLPTNTIGGPGIPGTFTFVVDELNLFWQLETEFILNYLIAVTLFCDFNRLRFIYLIYSKELVFLVLVLILLSLLPDFWILVGSFLGSVQSHNAWSSR